MISNRYIWSIDVSLLLGDRLIGSGVSSIPDRSFRRGRSRFGGDNV